MQVLFVCSSQRRLCVSLTLPPASKLQSLLDAYKGTNSLTGKGMGRACITLTRSCLLSQLGSPNQRLHLP